MLVHKIEQKHTSHTHHTHHITLSQCNMTMVTLLTRKGLNTVSRCTMRRRCICFSTESSHHEERTLTHAHLKGTHEILSNKGRQLVSPCVGAAFENSALFGNLLRIGQTLPKGLPVESTVKGAEPHFQFASSAHLARLLLYQQDRTQPVRPTRSKSTAAAHLTPRLLGTVMGIGHWVSCHGSKHQRDHFIETALKLEGVRTNHVHDEWTGVSGARWRELVHAFTNSLPPKDGTIIYNSPAIPMCLRFLWDISHSKLCLLEFLLSFERYSKIQVLGKTDLCNALRHDSTARDEWATMKFDKNDLSNENVQQACKWLVENSQSVDDRAQWSRMFEIVCAAAADSRAHRPTIPNRKYGFDGGPPKPDYVEVTIRELFEYLLWDEMDAKYDVGRLPNTASQDIVSWYNGVQNTSETLLQNAQKDDPLGQRWFSILSDAPNCQYLATSSNGKPYELVPTLANVATATQNLWCTTSCTEIDDNVPMWTSLDDLVSEWNSADGCDYNRPRLQIEYRAPLGEEIEHKEVALVSLEGSSRAIEMRLDKAHALSAVTHLRTSTERGRLDGITRSLFTTKFFPSTDEMSKNCSDCSMLALAMLDDEGLDNLQEKNITDMTALEALLLARYKDDRKITNALIGTSDKLRRREGARRAFAESCSVSLCALQVVCDISVRNAALGEMLLPWILMQLPDENDSLFDIKMKPGTGVPTSSLIKQLQRVSAESLEKEDVREALRFRTDGEVILRTLDFHSGRASIFDAIKGLKMKETLKLVTFPFWAS